MLASYLMCTTRRTESREWWWWLIIHDDVIPLRWRRRKITKYTKFLLLFGTWDWVPLALSLKLNPRSHHQSIRGCLSWKFLHCCWSRRFYTTVDIYIYIYVKCNSCKLALVYVYYRWLFFSSFIINYSFFILYLLSDEFIVSLRVSRRDRSRRNAKTEVK